MQKKIVHVARGNMEVLLVIYQVSEEPRSLVFWLITHSILAASAGLVQYKSST